MSKLSELDDLIDEEKRKWKQQVESVHFTVEYCLLTVFIVISMRTKGMPMYWGGQKSYLRPRSRATTTMTDHK